MTQTKRFRKEQIKGTGMQFIVDESTRKENSNGNVSYKAYSTTDMTCDELVDLLNAFNDLKEMDKGIDGMTGKRFEVMDYFDSENKPIKAIRDTETTEIYSMDNELEANSTCGLLNTLHEEKEYLKIRFKEERELAMKISRECDALTIKKQELELELIRLETIRTGKKVNGGND